jgi:predicted nuclease of predicted toxin-antitoxin system
MKLLLDENLPHELRHLLLPHEVYTVAYMKWAGIGNGRLLRLAASAGFLAFVTLDQGIADQQYPGTLPLHVVLISAKSNRMEDLQIRLVSVLAALEGINVLSPPALIHA